MDHLVDDEGNVPFGLLAGDVGGEPFGKARFKGVEEFWRESPEVHGDTLVPREVLDFGSGIVIVGSCGRFDELDVLHDLGEASGVIERADPARDAAVIGERQRELVADHGEGQLVAGLGTLIV